MAQVFIGAQQKSRRCFPKESSVLSKRIDGAKQKNRRFFLKEATMLRGSSQYTFRNHLTAMPWEVIITGPKHNKIIVFPLGFREAFSCCLPVSVDSSGATL